MTWTVDPTTDFARDGFIIARGVFSREDFTPLKDEITAHIDARARALQAEGLLDDLHEEAPFSRRFGLIHRRCPDIQQGMDINQVFGREMFRLMHHSSLLDVVESLIGGEISCNPIQHLRAKPPRAPDDDRPASFFEVPWHQDSGVTTEDADGATLLTTWIPIGDATAEMGCMRLIPGAHRDGHLPHVRSDYGTTIDPTHMPATEPVLAECREGDVVVMSQFTPHHSTPNRSDRCRWSMDLRYQPIGTPSGRAWQPSFVVRSRSGQHRVLEDADEWERRWREAMSHPDYRGPVHRVVEAAR